MVLDNGGTSCLEMGQVFFLGGNSAEVLARWLKREKKKIPYLVDERLFIKSMNF
jgi:hypothetical protein